MLQFCNSCGEGVTTLCRAPSGTACHLGLPPIKRKLSDEDWNRIIDQSLEAARKATLEHLKKNPNQWYPCGFAWVNIKPARGKIVQILKDRELGHIDTYNGGYTVYNPGKHETQWMDAKAAGARAMADVLKAHGVKCTVETRID